MKENSGDRREDQWKEWLQEEGKHLLVPESLSPERMRERMETQAERHREIRRKKQRIYKSLASAACLIFLLLAVSFLQGEGPLEFMSAFPQQGKGRLGSTVPNEKNGVFEEEESEEDGLGKDKKKMEGWKQGDEERSYEDIYSVIADSFPKETKDSLTEPNRTKASEGTKIAADLEDEAFHRNEGLTVTNVREKGVEEGDIVKNDGRYLYQLVTDFEKMQQCIQITDTKGGLNVLVQIADFTNIAEFYITGNQLIVIEQEGSGGLTCGVAVDDIGYGNQEVPEGAYRMILYDITDRTKPEKVNTHNWKGSYQTSRLSEGYLYILGHFQAERGEGEKDYASYIPGADGTLLLPEDIWIPENSRNTNYLVVAVLDLRHPDVLADSKAILTSAEACYVTKQNIYVTDYLGIMEENLQTQAKLERKDGAGRIGSSGEEEKQKNHTKKGERIDKDQTSIVRISYSGGKLVGVKEAVVDGCIRNSFSMDESHGKLRVAATVHESVMVQRQKEDKGAADGEETAEGGTGHAIGKESAGDVRWEVDDTRSTMSNSLYVLNEDMETIGKVARLAEGESIYSVRFLEHMAYFVTFRQVDPLFSVDLSNPKQPEVLGKQKFTGFSTYLHPFAEGLLLGIGMETDAKGQQTELKLSMFDISDPEQVKESAKKVLKGYSYSEALYEHRAAMVDTERNLFGFLAERYTTNGRKQEYLVYSYVAEDEKDGAKPAKGGKFIQRLRIPCNEADPYPYRFRGVSMDDMAYLLSESGRVLAYNLESGRKVGEVKGLSASAPAKQ